MVIPNVPFFRQMKEYTCAPACLRMAWAFRFPDRPVPEEVELEYESHTDRILGTEAEEAFRVAREYHLDAKLLNQTKLEAEVETAINSGCPVMANIPLSALPYHGTQPPSWWHSVLIVGLDLEFVYVHDPDDPLYRGQSHRTGNLAESYVDRKIERAVFFAEWTKRVPKDKRWKYVAFRL